MSGQWSSRLFWLAGMVNLRLCVGLVAALSVAEIGKQEASDIDA